MNGWAYVGAAAITAFAVAGVGYFTNVTSLSVAEATRQHAEEQRLWEARKKAYYRVMRWIHVALNDLAPWNHALTHGHPDRPTQEPALPEALPEETMAQVWTVGSPSIVNSVYAASAATNQAIGILQRFTWVVPPDRYEEAKVAMKEAESALYAAIDVIRRDMKTEPFADALENDDATG